MPLPGLAPCFLSGEVLSAKLCCWPPVYNNNNNHFKTARSYLFECHPTCLSQTLDTRPLRLRSYPLRGVHTYSLQAGPGQATGRPRTVGLASGNADQRQPYPKRGGQGTDDDDDDDQGQEEGARGPGGQRTGRQRSGATRGKTARGHEGQRTGPRRAASGATKGSERASVSPARK